MKVIYNDLSELSAIKSVVAIGSFDGVHCAHRQILSTLSNRASQLGAKSVVISFDPHPRQFFEKNSSNFALLSTVEEKAFLLSHLSIDYLVILDFEQIYSLTAQQFSSKILTQGVGCIEIFAGYNHHIGCDKILARNHFDGREGRPKIFYIEKIELGGHKVSSTEVRGAISDGNISLARELLGGGYLFIAPIDHNGMVQICESIKLLPPEGNYIAMVDGRETELISHNKKLTIKEPKMVDISPNKRVEIYLLKDI